MKTPTITKIGTATTREGDEITLRADRDGRYRWYLNDSLDTEVSGSDAEEACDLAGQAWSGIEFDFVLVDGEVRPSDE